jgi:hypothetical protein
MDVLLFDFRDFLFKLMIPFIFVIADDRFGAEEE